MVHFKLSKSGLSAIIINFTGRSFRNTWIDLWKGDDETSQNYDMIFRFLCQYFRTIQIQSLSALSFWFEKCTPAFSSYSKMKRITNSKARSNAERTFCGDATNAMDATTFAARIPTVLNLHTRGAGSSLVWCNQYFIANRSVSYRN